MMYAQAIRISHPGRQLQQTVVMVLFSMDGLLVQVKMSCLCSFKGGQGACVWPICCGGVEVSFAWSLRCILLTLQMALQPPKGRQFLGVCCAHSRVEPARSHLSVCRVWVVSLNISHLGRGTLTYLETGQFFSQPRDYMFIPFLNKKQG